jgi:hypothetical protein
MTRPLPFTEAGLRRAIAAARKSGLRVTGIRPDGTLIVIDGDNSPDEVVRLARDWQSAAASKWEDVEA